MMTDVKIRDSALTERLAGFDRQRLGTICAGAREISGKKVHTPVCNDPPNLRGKNYIQVAAEFAKT